MSLQQSTKRIASKKPPKPESKPVRQSMRKPQDNEHFELTQLQPLTDRQADFFDSFNDGKHIIGYGSSGTGKTLTALYLSIKYVLETKKAKRVIIIRSPLSVNNQGFLPGTLEEKEAVYERPYIDIVNWLTNDNEGYQKMKDVGIIQFQTTSYIRGLTWDDSIIISDEVQNMLWEEINTIVTRKGVNSRLILIGDLKQNDLAIVAKRNQQTGMEKLLLVAKLLKDVDMIKFLPEDIVRDEFVKEWIIACEQFEDVV